LSYSLDLVFWCQSIFVLGKKKTGTLIFIPNIPKIPRASSYFVIAELIRGTSVICHLDQN
jgi:hypothetical protein